MPSRWCPRSTSGAPASPPHTWATRRSHDYRVPSSLAVEVASRLAEGAPFVYAYYDGIDKVAHAHGLDDALRRRTGGRRPDRRRRRRRAPPRRRPPGDRGPRSDRGGLAGRAARERGHGHGPLLLGRGPVPVAPRPARGRRTTWPTCARSATARRPGCAAGTSWSTTDGSADRWPTASPTRLGDVALIPFEPIAFVDPADTGENRLACRHGSLTTDEMLVPLVALRGG